MAGGEVVEVLEGPVLTEIHGGLDESGESLVVPGDRKGLVQVLLEQFSGVLQLILETDFEKENELLLNGQIILNIKLERIEVNLPNLQLFE